MNNKLQLGDVVVCQDQIRRVVYLYETIDGGVKLDQPVGDFKSWNEDSLVFVRNATPDEYDRLGYSWGSRW